MPTRFPKNIKPRITERNRLVCGERVAAVLLVVVRLLTARRSRDEARLDEREEAFNIVISYIARGVA